MGNYYEAPNMLWVSTQYVMFCHNKAPNMLYPSPNVIISKPNMLSGITQYVIGNHPNRYGESPNMLRLRSNML